MTVLDFRRYTQTETDQRIAATLDAEIAANTARAWLLNRAVALTTHGEWRNNDVRDRMATVLANTVVGVTPTGHLSATTPGGEDGEIWHYVARDAIAAALPAADLIMIDDNTWETR